MTKQMISKTVTTGLLMAAGLLLAACGATEPAAGGIAATSGEGTGTHAMVFKIQGNPFGDRMFDGFRDAVETAGGTAIFSSPAAQTVEGQIQIIETLIAQGVDSITLAANDYTALDPVLNVARSQGINIISVDSAVNATVRDVHINQADAHGIASVLINGIYEMLDGQGQFAILSETTTAVNQNLWIELMLQYLEQPQFANLEMVHIAYGNAQMDMSVSETQGLLSSFPELRGIISPTTVGIAAAGLVITDMGLIGEVFVTGLGLPSEMATYIENGTTPFMYLWNPIDLGYVAGQAALAVTSGVITGAVGEQFTAGTFGQLTVVEDGNGTQIMMGNPYRFHPDNIDFWREVF